MEDKDGKDEEGEENTGVVESRRHQRESKRDRDDEYKFNSDAEYEADPPRETRGRSESTGSDGEVWTHIRGAHVEVEREYRAAIRRKNVGNTAVSRNPRAKAIVDGFKINWMDMRDADTNRLMWESGEWGKEMCRQELKATVPKAILKCSAVSREISFTSQQKICQFRLEQRVFLEGSCIEEWFFDFGFVIPGSTNSWQQTIESAGEDRMLAAEDLSGRMTIETTFLDGKEMLFKTLVKIFYD